MATGIARRTSATRLIGVRSMSAPNNTAMERRAVSERRPLHASVTKSWRPGSRMTLPLSRTGTFRISSSAAPICDALN
jgi:hypothetical protein